MRYIPYQSWKYFSRIRCSCGCYPKDHSQRTGWCDKCGCTWYHPNDKFVLKMRKLGFKKFSQIAEYRKERGLR